MKWIVTNRCFRLLNFSLSHLFQEASERERKCALKLRAKTCKYVLEATSSGTFWLVLANFDSGKFLCSLGRFIRQQISGA